jgi:hypothetical protein
MYEIMNDMAEMFIRVLKMIIKVICYIMAVALLIVLFVTIPLWIMPFLLYKGSRNSRKGTEVRKGEVD